jgi:regulator of protease activity HflC (stomatin/prohibitin superfamily)
MSKGLKVRQVLVTQLTPPLAVRAEFDAVAAAESERASSISNAQKEETEVMTGAAGQGYPQLLELIQAYEKARRTGDTKGAAELESKIRTLLESEAIGGKARKVLGEAEAYKREAVQRVAADAARFKVLLAQNQQNPRIFRDRKLQDVRQELLSSSRETFYVPQGLTEFILMLGTDPDLQRKREDARYKGVK